MAESGTNNSNNTQRRRNKIVVSGGVGGIAGVLIVGGVIAVTSLLRYRASKKISDAKKKKLETSDVNEVKDESEGLHTLIQSIGDDASGASSSKIDSSDPEPEEEAVETPTTVIIHEQKPAIESGKTVTEEAPEEVSALDNEEVLLIKDGCAVPSLPLEEATEYTDDDNEDEDEEEERSSDEEEDEIEREIEDSEGTGDSSTGSHSEAIWPAESIEKELLLLKGRNIDNEAKVEEDQFELINRLTTKKDGGFELTQHPSFFRSKPSVSIASILLLLALGLLYVLFAQHLPSLFHSQLSSS